MLQPSSGRVLDRRRGGVTVWLVLCLGILIGIVALGMDGGRMMDEKRHVQAAADAAALASATDLYNYYQLNQGSDPAGTAAQAAQTSAAANGYNNDGTGSQVTVNIPPLSGPYQGKAGYVEVIVQSNLQAGFSAIFNGGHMIIQARAVALGQPKSIGILLLQSLSDSALAVSGNATLNVTRGLVAVNSASADAVQLSGNAAIAAQAVSITGAYVGSKPNLTGPVYTNASATADPLQSLAAPNADNCAVQSSSATSVSGTQIRVLQPGEYQGGISISGNAVVTMQPGIYVMNGGGFQVSGNASVTGAGVMVYNTSSGTSQSSPGGILLRGNGVINLTPPTSGAYAGIGFFQDRSLTTALQVSGNGSLQLPGVVYAPAAAISLSGNASVPGNIVGGGFIAATLQLSGNAAVTIDPLNNYVKVPNVRLVE